MFVRIEVAVKPDQADPQAKLLLRQLEVAHPEIRRLIRRARFLDVFWIEIDCPRDKLITVVGELFWDRVINLLFTGDLIP